MDPIWPGARMTVMEYCHIRMLEKQRSKTNDTQFDRDSRLVSEYYCPEGNFVPPSFYLVRKLLESREAQECERHVCTHDKHVFPPALPSEYHQHRDDECPCGERRFDEVRI